MNADTTIFELRSYRVLDGMHDKFAQHVRDVRMPVYDRIGWRCDGFWSAAEQPSKVYYMLHWESLEERAEKRAVLAADPEWLAYRNSDPEKLVDDFQFTLMSRIDRTITTASETS